MRTTLTLEADVARTLKAAVRQRKVTFKEEVNHALRAGLGIETSRRRKSPFVVQPHRGGVMAGIDSHKLNKLAAELEDNAILARMRRP
jgi:hypothetical protein